MFSSFKSIQRIEVSYIESITVCYIVKNIYELYEFITFHYYVFCYAKVMSRKKRMRSRHENTKKNTYNSYKQLPKAGLETMIASSSSASVILGYLAL